MRLDIRAVFLNIWITLFCGTLSSSLVFNYYQRAANHPPQTLRESLGLILGLWLGALLVGAVSALWANLPPRTLAWSALVGYELGAGIRLIYLQQFLPSGDHRFDTLLEMLTLQGLPPYDAFVLWVIVGGGLISLLGWLALLNFPRVLNLNFPLRLWGGVWGLMSLSLLNLILIRSLDTNYSEITLLNTQWLLSPVLNLFLAAILGFAIGGFYFCPTRWDAAAVMFMGLASHLIWMWLLDGLLSSYDPLYVGIHPNDPQLITYVLVWVGTPVMGMLAAFTLHNLRDALSLTPEMGSEV